MAITDLKGTTWYVPSGWECLPAPLYGSGYVSDSAFVVYDLDNNIICDYSTNYAPEGYDPHYYGNIGLGKSGTVTESNNTANSILFFDSQTLDSVTINNSKGFVVSFVAASSFSEEFVSFLTTYGIQLKVTDLTNTTWTVNAGWEAEAGYGEFNVTGRLLSQGFNFTAISIGEDDGDYVDNFLCFTPYMAIGNNEVANMSFTSGTDVTTPKLIAWLSKYGELKVEEEGEAPPDDLTGYTVTVPANWSATAGYGVFTLSGEFYTEQFDASSGLSSIYIGSYDDFGDIIPYADTVQLAGYTLTDNNCSFTLTITGGSDTSKTELIQWLVDNNATFVKEGGEEEPEEPETPEEESVTHAVEVYYEGNNIAFLDAGETVAIHMKDKSSPFKLTEDLIIKANILENSSGGGASFGNGYTVTFMSQGAAWAVSGITPGQAVQRPTSPTKDGAYFNGWYTGEDGSGEKISFPYTPTADATLYAKFSQATVVGVTGVMNEEGSLTLTDDIAGMEGYEETQNGDYVSVTSKLSEAFPFCEIEEFTDDEGNIFVKFPKLWMKWETDASNQITGYKFANYQADSDFFIPDAFLDPNYVTTDTYLDYFALGKYEMSGSTSKGYSKSGATCLVNVTRANARAAARAYGNSSNLYNGYQMLDFAQMTLYNLLCMMFFQTTNIQKVYGGRTGSGTVTSWSAASVTGTTDGVDGLNGWNVTTDCVKLLGVENPFGNVYKWVDGVYFSGATIYAHRFPQQFNDGTTNGTALGFERPTSNGYITALKKGTANKTRSYAYAAATGGDAGQYCGDYTWYSSTGTVLCAGGRWSNGGDAGLWYLGGNSVASYSNSSIGARLSYRPL